MRISRRQWMGVSLQAIACTVLPTSLYAQTADDDMLRVVRADLRAKKISIVTAAMDLTSSQGAKFWPVYRNYETELITLNDERVRLTKEYADKYVAMTDAEAITLANRFLDWQTRRNDLRKKYLDIFVKATSGTIAAKFFQVEHRLDVILDLQVASELPGLFLKTSSAAKPAAKRE